MNKIYKISSIFVALLLLSACKTQGSYLKKENAKYIEKTVTDDVTKNVTSVTSSTAATSNAATKINTH
jgi:hypothetical protein